MTIWPYIQVNKYNADNNCYLGTLDNHDNEQEEVYDEIVEDGKYYREKTEVAQALSVSSSTHRYSKWPQDLLHNIPVHNFGLHMLIIIRSIPSSD
jgi:hypothetical protein